MRGGEAILRFCFSSENFLFHYVVLLIVIITINSVRIFIFFKKWNKKMYLSWCLYKSVLFMLCIKEGIIVHSLFVSVDSFVIICFHLFHRFFYILFQFLFICFVGWLKKRVASKIDRLQTSFPLLFLNSTYDDNYAWLARCEFPPFSFLFPLLPTIIFISILILSRLFLASLELNGCSWTLNYDVIKRFSIER